MRQKRKVIDSRKTTKTGKNLRETNKKTHTKSKKKHLKITRNLRKLGKSKK